MSYCEYHLNIKSAFLCEDCNIEFCGNCSDHTDYTCDARCLKCNNQMVTVKHSGIDKPFWRRLKQSFRYPLNLKTIAVIAIFVVLTSLLPYLPFKFILAVIVGGAFFKYLFTCLRQSAMGDFETPDALEALEGGFISALKVIGLFVALMFIAGLFFKFFNYQLFIFFSFCLVMLVPAIVMIFALNESLLDALNPVNTFNAVYQLGVQYFAFIGFIFVMMGSAGVLNSFIVAVLPDVSTFLTSCVTLYYCIVAFHVMGYMVFENQHGLLKYSSQMHEVESIDQSEVDVCLARVSVYVKEGNFNNAITAFDQGIKLSPNDYNLSSKYFDFLVATQAYDKLKVVGGRYLGQLVKTHRKERIYSTYKSIVDLTGHFEISQLVNKIQISQVCYDRGDYKKSVNILKNVRREHPSDPLLLDAFQIMHDALVFIPGQEKTGLKISQIIKELMSKDDVGKNLVDRSQANTAIKTTLRPDKRIDFHGHKKVFNTMSSSTSAVLDDQAASKFKQTENKPLISGLQFDDKLDTQQGKPKDKYSNFGTAKQDDSNPENEILSLNEEIENKGFNLNQHEDFSANNTQPSFKRLVSIDDVLSQDDLESMYSGETDYKSYGTSVSLDTSIEIPENDGEELTGTELIDAQLTDDGLTLDDSDSISNTSTQEPELELKLGLEEEYTQTLNKGGAVNEEPDINENAIEFIDIKQPKKVEKSHYADNLGAIKFD